MTLTDTVASGGGGDRGNDRGGDSGGGRAVGFALLLLCLRSTSFTA